MGGWTHRWTHRWRHTKALNAHFMGCDAFEEGDLLVTFPGCKAPQMRFGSLLSQSLEAIRFLCGMFAVGSLHNTNISNIFTHASVDSPRSLMFVFQLSILLAWNFMIRSANWPCIKKLYQESYIGGYMYHYQWLIIDNRWCLPAAHLVLLPQPVFRPINAK